MPGKDLYCPIYHFLPPANWMNDPNGPIRYKGNYHIFYQHNPEGAEWGNMHWGHAVSRDLVHWQNLPIALAPGPEDYDRKGVFSGCTVIDRGVPTIIYTGVHPEAQCLAVSDDGMTTWRKHPANPVLADPPPGLDLVGFRDPFAWQEGDLWHIAIGSGIKGTGGTVLHYTSCDLVNWEFIGHLFTGDIHCHEEMWECPNFFPLGEKHVLLVSIGPRGALCFTGNYDGIRFSPDAQMRLDLGDAFYATNCLLDDNGRRLLWGWVQEKAPIEMKPGWSGVLSLPREIFLHSDGDLGVRPVAELEELRRRHFHIQDEPIAPQRTLLPKEAAGDSLEITADIASNGVGSVGLSVGCSPSGSEETLITYDFGSGGIYVDRGRSSLDSRAEKSVVGGVTGLCPGGLLKLRCFVDRSVLEIYINERYTLTTRIYPTDVASRRVGLFTGGGNATVRSLDIWEMASIY